MRWRGLPTPSSEPTPAASSARPSGLRPPLQRRCIPRLGVGGALHSARCTPDRSCPGSNGSAPTSAPALGRDVFAGIVLTAILIPAGMGYAEASGLPPIIGLYATILPLVAYALLGPSRILVLGPDSALLPIIAAAIVPLAAGDEARAVALAGLLAVLVGLIVIGAAFARLGFLTDLLSAPVRQGYLNGIALIIVVSQLPRLFGFSTDGDSVLERGGAFLTGVRDGETNTVALAIGAACLAIILGLRYRWPRVPGILIAVVGVDDRVGRPRSRGALRDRGRRATSRRSAAAQPAAARPERHPRHRARRVRDRPGRRDGHEHPVPVVLEPPRRGGRPGPRAARARWREPGRPGSSPGCRSAAARRGHRSPRLPGRRPR